MDKLKPGVTELEYAVSKSTSSKETPPKRKHVRKIILSSTRAQQTVSFFRYLTKRPLDSNEIVAYKSLIVVHSFLQEGNQRSLQDAHFQTSVFSSLQKTWARGSPKGFGPLISEYANFVIEKVNFHHLHPEFEGDFSVEKWQAQSKGAIQPDSGSQTAVHLLDLQDLIIKLSKLILEFREKTDIVFAPLIPLIKESYAIYLLVTQFLKKLVEVIDGLDVFSYLTERYYTQYHSLRTIFFEASNAKFVKSNLSVPLLPKEAPKIIQDSKKPTPAPPKPAATEVPMNPFNDEAFGSNFFTTSPSMNQFGSYHPNQFASQNPQNQFMSVNNGQFSQAGFPANQFGADPFGQSQFGSNIGFAQHGFGQQGFVANAQQDPFASQSGLNSVGVSQPVSNGFGNNYDDQFGRGFGMFPQASLNNNAVGLTAAQNMGGFTDQYGRLVDASGRLIDNKGRLIDAQGRLVDELGRLINEEGYLVDAQGRLVDEQGRLIDSQGRLINEKGQLIDALGRLIDEHGRLVDEQGRLVDEQGRLIDANGRLIDSQGRFVDERGRLVDQLGRLIDAQGRLIDEHGRLIDENGYLVDEKGRYIDEQGRLIDKLGRLINEQGKLIDPQGRLIDEQGRLVDEKGRLVDIYGKLINEKGQLIDEYGRLVNEKGLYIDQYGRLVDAKGRLVDQQGRLIDDKGRLIDEKGRLIDERGRFIDEMGRLIDEHGRLIDDRGRLIDAKGRLVDAKGRLIDEQGRLIDEQGRLVDDKGRLVDEHGRLIDSKGRLIDEQGRLVDEHGRPLSKFTPVFSSTEDEAEFKRYADDNEARFKDLEGRFLAMEKSLEQERQLRLQAQQEIVKLSQENLALKQHMAKIVASHEAEKKAAIAKGLQTAERDVENALLGLDNPNNMGDQEAEPEDVLLLNQSINHASEKLTKAAASNNNDDLLDAVKELSEAMQKQLSTVKGLTRLTENSDIKDELLTGVRQEASSVSSLLETVRNQPTDLPAHNQKKEDVKQKSESLTKAVGSLQKEEAGVEEHPEDDSMHLEQMAERELLNAAQAIEAAAESLRRTKLQAKPKDVTPEQMAVADAILDAAMAIALATANMVKSATNAQKERVQRGLAGGLSANAYKQSKMWSEGLISASKAVATATAMLVEVANQAVTGKVDDALLRAAAKEVAASTAQLVAACRSKAGDMSKTLDSLEGASKAVNVATSKLVEAATALAARAREDELANQKKEPVSYTPTAAKILEMEKQANILRLEKQLQQEREQLFKIRQQGYKK